MCLEDGKESRNVPLILLAADTEPPVFPWKQDVMESMIVKKGKMRIFVIKTLPISMIHRMICSK